MAKKMGRPAYGHCPPSSEPVMEALEASEEPLDPQEIQERTGLARRTVFLALRCLEGMKAVVKGMSLRDTRRRKYMVPGHYQNGDWKPCIKDCDCVDEVVVKKCSEDLTLSAAPAD